MIKYLTVTNLAVIERAEADFTDGLNVITGETGAGKSVLMGAIALALGGKADAGIVREGAKEAEVELTIDDLTFRRTITKNGRSRCWLNDESVTIAELKAAAERKVTFHSARANQLIYDERFQREALDAYGKIDLTAYAESYAEYAAAEKRLAELTAISYDEDEVELLRFQVNEIENAKLTSEDEDIAERHNLAAKAEETCIIADELTEGLGGDNGVAEQLARLHPNIVRLSKWLPVAKEWSEKIESLTIEAQELSREVAAVANRSLPDRNLLNELDERLTLVNKLKRKYGATIEAVLTTLATKREKLSTLENLSVEREELSEAIKGLKAKAVTLGEAVTEARKTAAVKLAKMVEKELKSLGFNAAEFQITIAPSELGPTGADNVVYMFAPNLGDGLKPLANIASAGESARVMLAIKGLTTKSDQISTLIFDEVDANIGGEIGTVVGEKLHTLAQGRQIIAITHLPQSAVFGANHLVVTKSVANGRTRTTIDSVTGEARISEVARMLGGENITTVVRKHAEELLRISG